jgi:hypothetical protein
VKLPLAVPMCLEVPVVADGGRALVVRRRRPESVRVVPCH